MNGCLAKLVLALLLAGLCLLAGVMSDFDALDGTEGGYVPCNEAAADLPATDDDAAAISGHEVGYVPVDVAAAALPADTDDFDAISGHAVGFVAKPCVECVRLNGSFEWSSMDVGPSGTAWDTIDGFAPTHQTAGAQNTIASWSRRGLASIHIGTIPGATHARLTATLRNYIALTAGPHVIGNEAPVEWELVAGNWGTGTPVWDSGTVIATGTIPASSSSFDIDGLLVVPFREVSIVVTWPISGSYAQWYFRNVSPTGFRYPQPFAPPFTPGLVVDRFDTSSDPDRDPQRSLVHPPPLTTAAYEDWTLDVMHCP